MPTKTTQLPRLAFPVVRAETLFNRLKARNGHRATASIGGGVHAPDGYLLVLPNDQFCTWLISCEEYARLDIMIDAEVAKRKAMSRQRVRRLHQEAKEALLA